MTKVIKYNEIVEEILEEDKASRDCDYKLYFELINKINVNYTNHMLEMTLMDALHSWHKKEIPSLFSISRSRRIIQEKYANIPSKNYLCGNRKEKKSLSEEFAEEIIINKIKEKDGDNTSK